MKKIILIGLVLLTPLIVQAKATDAAAPIWKLPPIVDRQEILNQLHWQGQAIRMERLHIPMSTEKFIPQIAAWIPEGAVLTKDVNGNQNFHWLLENISYLLVLEGDKDFSSGWLSSLAMQPQSDYQSNRQFKSHSTSQSNPKFSSQSKQKAGSQSNQIFNFQSQVNFLQSPKQTLCSEDVSSPDMTVLFSLHDSVFPVQQTSIRTYITTNSLEQVRASLFQRLSKAGWRVTSRPTMPNSQGLSFPFEARCGLEYLMIYLQKDTLQTRVIMMSTVEK
jgi:hypothetical protein